MISKEKGERRGEGRREKGEEEKREGRREKGKNVRVPFIFR